MLHRPCYTTLAYDVCSAPPDMHRSRGAFFVVILLHRFLRHEAKSVRAEQVDDGRKKARLFAADALSRISRSIPAPLA
jgi:hypothetical protein